MAHPETRKYLIAPLREDVRGLFQVHLGGAIGRQGWAGRGGVVAIAGWTPVAHSSRTILRYSLGGALISSRGAPPFCPRPPLQPWVILMSQTDREVVVISPVTMRHNEADGVFAARFAEMGLTAFGDSPGAAVEALKRVFRTYIHACREHSVLEKNLTRLGVQWYWKDEYPDDAPEYEDTNRPAAPSLKFADGGATMPERLAPLAEDWDVTVANSDLAMAA